MAACSVGVADIAGLGAVEAHDRAVQSQIWDDIADRRLADAGGASFCRELLLVPLEAVKTRAPLHLHLGSWPNLDRAVGRLGKGAKGSAVWAEAVADTREVKAKAVRASDNIFSIAYG